MAKKVNDGYLSAKESRRISRENRKITNALEKKHKRRNVPESEYLSLIHIWIASPHVPDVTENRRSDAESASGGH